MTIDDEVIAEARSWIGTPYGHQHSLKGVSCDCLGLLRGVYTNVTGKPYDAPPPYSSNWAESGNGEQMLDAANKYLIPVFWTDDIPFEAGQVLVFRFRKTAAAKHCALATSATSMVHSYQGVGVKEVTTSDFWIKLCAGVFRFPES